MKLTHRIKYNRLELDAIVLSLNIDSDYAGLRAVAKWNDVRSL